ncbi:hypothetical protein Taro_048855 [Colocasia esculenta]|uniref:Uncharacterized protein n=1 Tax=Colocasia esculenta TaxID=4460 RepID=A0A843X990_COLES|nr:hypothetical protein [Colocasia esculenta]
MPQMAAAASTARLGRLAPPGHPFCYPTHPAGRNHRARLPGTSDQGDEAATARAQLPRGS